MRKIRPDLKRKSFGQHFLKDQNVIQTIVKETYRHLETQDPKNLIEIGPGKGAITFPILEQAVKNQVNLTLIEKDRELVEFWNQREEKFHLIEGDFLHLKKDDWLKNEKTIIVSNLPYSASSQILLELILLPKNISAMILMFQKEVARRVIATQSDSEFGRISLLCQNEWDISSLCEVSPKAFRPPPKVHSEVIVLTPRKEPKIKSAAQHQKQWWKLTKLCFMHRRKTLKNNLLSNKDWLHALEQSQIDVKKRAEALTWEEWESLLEAFIQDEKF